MKKTTPKLTEPLTVVKLEAIYAAIEDADGQVANYERELARLESIAEHKLDAWLVDGKFAEYEKDLVKNERGRLAVFRSAHRDLYDRIFAAQLDLDHWLHMRRMCERRLSLVRNAFRLAQLSPLEFPWSGMPDIMQSLADVEND